MMTESEFMSLACVGGATHDAGDPKLVFPALIAFLHANRHHDVARVVESLHDEFDHLKSNQMPFGV